MPGLTPRTSSGLAFDHGFAEVELGLKDQQACQEAKWCLRCDLLERQAVEQREEEEPAVSCVG